MDICALAMWGNYDITLIPRSNKNMYTLLQLGNDSSDRKNIGPNIFYDKWMHKN